MRHPVMVAARRIEDGGGTGPAPQFEEAAGGT
jgi:hypothetical protein